MFTYVTFVIMYRLLVRAGKVAAQTGVPEIVKQVHDDVLAPCATAFCKAHDAVIEAESKSRAMRRQLQVDLAMLDSPYRTARTALLAYFPDKVLPDTLKVQPTDTDIELAVTAVSSLLQSHASEPWAAAMLNGPFGTYAPKVIATLQELDATTTVLAEARQARAIAQKPAHVALVAFRRLVRDTFGASSIQYRKLRFRARSVAVEDTEEAAPESGVVPSTKGATDTQTGGPTSVKVA